MDNKKEENSDRAWFLTQELDKIKKQHEDDVKDNHADWKNREKERESSEKKHVSDYDKSIIQKDSSGEHKQKNKKMIGGVRGKLHPKTKMDRKGRTNKS